MRWIVSTAPAAEPVTLDEAKKHLRVIISADDGLIESLIVAARQHIEMLCEHALMRQSWTLYLDGFSDCIRLPGGMVKEVTEINYVDTAGVDQSVDVASTVLDHASRPARLARKADFTWPATAAQINAVDIVYSVGYDDADSMPFQLKAALLLIVGDLYENREGSVIGETIAENPAVDRLLFGFRRVEP